ncbi:MAG: penicillin-insensitive murein endopeptidase [Myxococcales bacterium]|nr:penicillin-insensitive murein endopeptidase [Myxococcales bacterium]
MRARLAIGLMAATVLACAGPDLWTDLTSVSSGRTNDGRVRRPVEVGAKGEGRVVPKRWQERGLNYGVDELVEAIDRAAKFVAAQAPGGVLGVADLSPLRGGRSRWHSSHQSGRDVDLIFYSTDEDGVAKAPLPEDMLHYDGDGVAYAPRRVTYVAPDWASRRFDTHRNWLLLEALLRDTQIRVQWVFVSDPLKERLLAHAREAGRPAWLIEYAARLLGQPGDAPPHDDHFHVRIYCPRGDRFHGCEDRGVVWRHEKKSIKYGGPERYDPVLRRLVTVPALLGPA